MKSRPVMESDQKSRINEGMITYVGVKAKFAVAFATEDVLPGAGVVEELKSGELVADV